MLNAGEKARVEIASVRACEMSQDAFYRMYFRCNQPVLIEDGAAQWPAIKRWTPAYLKQLLGSRTVMVKHHAQGIFDYNKSAATGAVGVLSVAFDSAVDLIESAGTPVHYLQQERIQQFPELIVDLCEPYVLEGTRERSSTNLWFGARGAKSPLHFDQADNLLAQVVGDKRVTLFSPQDSPLLYPATGDRLPHCSRVNVFAPDIGAFPLFAQAQARQITLRIEPGNILYIPKGWWHAVESLDVAISVNTWWQQKPVAAGATP